VKKLSGKLFFEDAQVESEIPFLVKKVTLLQLAIYSGVTWNFYKLHWDREFARGKGFRDVNAHGPLLGAFLSQMLVNWIGESGTLKKLKYAIRGMTFPGDTVTCKGKVANRSVGDGGNLLTCNVWIENQNGEKVVTGEATMALPSRA